MEIGKIDSIRFQGARGKIEIVKALEGICTLTCVRVLIEHRDAAEQQGTHVPALVQSLRPMRSRVSEIGRAHV